MAHYRILLKDGSQRTRQATRTRTDAHTLYLEERAAGTWRETAAIPLADVDTLHRRFTEHDGSWTWLNEPLPAPVGVRGWQ
ncbi:hypothetical protein [Nocardiopsis sp. NRRL B-16309]|uniref:hypothetical protein n=1 Tax=Nocardiopsis sp. NRRL B-16309 TaxID=1519494 RepID=UPI0006AFF45F|nr:hypothetical protein [Nocardiopsis sp. NRRL B-16309]KOX16490.1 hypothetical protein ADL05_12320 [Nocardiopsis sp. NRRL B-16309]